jgi:hypothetical protein
LPSEFIIAFKEPFNNKQTKMIKKQAGDTAQSCKNWGFHKDYGKSEINEHLGTDQ